MNDRKRKEFKLTEKDTDYINRIAEKYDLKTSEALSKIINEHIDSNEETNESRLLKKILAAVKNIDKLSEINLEVLNSICLKNNYKENDFVSKREFTADLINRAYNEVEKNIVEANIKKTR